MTKCAGFDNKNILFIQKKSEFKTYFYILISEIITAIQYAWKFLPFQMLKT